MVNKSLLSFLFSVSLCGASGCGGGGIRVVGGPKREAVPFENMTLENILHWPSGQEYLEAQGHGVPPEGEKDQQVRRRVAENAAVIEAQKELIKQLERMVPRDRIRDILRQARVGEERFRYDDACDLTLRIPKEAIVGKPPIQ